jgi:hypothetical protein
VRAALILIALFTAACGPPYGDCRPGNVRDPGPGCSAMTTPAITIDGDGSDWQGIPSAPLCTGDALACVNGWASAMQFVHQPDALAVHVITQGAPLDDATGVYHVELYQFYDLTHTDQLDVALVRSGATLLLNGHVLDGFTIPFAYGTDGIELAIPFTAIPFAGGSLALATVNTSAGFQPEPRQPVFVCWDGSRPEDCSAL